MYDEPETGTHRKVISPAYCRNPLHSGRGGGQYLHYSRQEVMGIAI